MQAGSGGAKYDSGLNMIEEEPRRQNYGPRGQKKIKNQTSKIKMAGKEDNEQPRHTPRAMMTGLSTSLAGQANWEAE